MRDGKTIWFSIGIWTVLFGICFGLLLGLIKQAAYILPDSYEFRNDNGLGISFDELQSASQYSTGEFAAFSQKGYSILHYGDKVQTLKLLFAIGDAAEVLSLPLEYGTFFTQEDSIPEESHYIVIDSRLSQELFFTPNSIGQVLEIDNVSYTVCGVYQISKSLLPQLCSDGYPIVFVPSSLATESEQAVQYLFVKSDGIHFSDAALEKVSAYCSQAASPLSTEDYAGTQSFLKQYVKLIAFSTSILLGVAAATLLSGSLPVIFFKNKISGTIKCHPKRLRFWGGCFMMVLSILGIVAFSFHLRLPAKWTPQDNIFDFSFYLNTFIAEWQQINTGTGCGFFQTYALYAVLVSTVLALLSAVCLLFAFAWLEYLIIHSVRHHG